MNESIVQTDLTHCYLCPCRVNLEEHHVFSGPNRKLSTRYKLTVALCPDHHRGKKGVHQNRELKESIERDGQTAFERLYGHEKFMSVFKKNYL